MSEQNYWDLYVDRGISVFPVKPMTKNPAVKWSEYQNRKPSRKELDEWKKSNYSIGVVCGNSSGNLVVIDFDREEVFKLFFPNVVEERRTWVVKTPRPGIHVYFRTDKPIRSRRYSEVNIDVKSEGGYVLAPPSIHPNGEKYVFLVPPEEADIPTIKSDDFFEMIEKRLAELGLAKNYTEEIPEEPVIQDDEEPLWVKRMLEGVNEGMRDECAIRLASYFLNKKHLSPAAVEGILLNWNKKNNPPMDDAVEWVRQKVSSALRGGYVYTFRDTLVRQFSMLTPEDEEKEKQVNEVLKGNFYQRLVEHAGRKVKNDDEMLQLTFLVFATSFLKTPVNLFIRGPSSIGKTYVTVNTAKYFPNTIILMGMSPKTIVHEYSSFSKEEGAYIVELWNKIIIFLEEPSMPVYEVLRPLMSHDKEEVEYKWVEQKKNKQRTMRSIIRGWPVFVFLGTTTKLLEDLITRGIHATPKMGVEKWMSAVELRGAEAAYPFNHMDAVDDELDVLKRAMKHVYEVVRTKNAGVIIPYAEHVAEIIKNSRFGKTPRSSRDILILFNLIAGSAVLNIFHRPLLRFRKNGKWFNFIIASLEDFNNACRLWLKSLPASAAGVNQTQYDLWLLIRNMARDITPQEITARLIYSEWLKNYPDKPLSYDTVRKYLNTLEDRGLLYSEKTGAKNTYGIIDVGNIHEEIAALSDELKRASKDWIMTWLGKIHGEDVYIVFDENDVVNIESLDTGKFISKIVNGQTIFHTSAQ